MWWIYGFVSRQSVYYIRDVKHFHFWYNILWILGNMFVYEWVSFLASFTYVGQMFHYNYRYIFRMCVWQVTLTRRWRLEEAKVHPTWRHRVPIQWMIQPQLLQFFQLLIFIISNSTYKLKWLFLRSANIIASSKSN